MIIQADIKGLEVVIAAWLSKDKVLYKELNDGIDLHGENQRIFGFPERVIAKIFLFKLLYGAMEYGFANDPDMNFISKNVKYWKKIIEKFYNKYQGIAAWHEKICSEVGKTGMLTTPLGRTFKWDCMQYGSFKIPTTQVKNFPVQGTGADVVSIARVSLYRRWKQAGIEGCLINTVHDSICLDVPNKSVDKSVELLYNVFQDVPANISRIFNVNFDLETKVEILVGHDMYHLEEIK